MHSRTESDVALEVPKVPNARSRLVISNWLWLACASIPFLVLVAFVARFAVDVPYWDEWEAVSLLDLDRRGALTFSDLSAQHNEHRLFFPRLAIVVLARFSNWSLAWELALQLFVAFLAFIVLRRQLPLRGGWLVLASLLFFGVSQWENWLWGWQIAVAFNIFGVALGLALVDHQKVPLSIAHLALAGTAGAFALYSFGNGLLFFPIAFALLFFRGASRRFLAIWSALSLLIALSYLAHYEKPSGHPSVTYVLEQPLPYALYIFAYVGHPIGQGPTESVIFGALAIVSAIGLLWVGTRRRKTAQWKGQPLALALMAYALFSAAVTGIGRAGFGWTQALMPRYIAFGSLFWIGLCALACALLPVRKIPIQWEATVLVLMILLVGRRHLFGVRDGANHADRMRAARVHLLQGDSAGLEALYPNPTRIVEGWRPFLKRTQTGPFRR